MWGAWMRDAAIHSIDSSAAVAYGAKSKQGRSSMGKAHTAFHNCLCFVSLAAAVLVAISQPANADSKLVLQTKAVLIIVGSSFEACYLTLGEANLLDRTGDL